MLEIYMDMLDGLDVYWGVSPVVTAASQSYWERKNNVIFPKNFAPTLEWSVDFSRQVMEMADKQEANVYLMPIKTNLEEYLAGVFA
jgi:methylenetetrahydrofolate reductase (NADPH)